MSKRVRLLTLALSLSALAVVGWPQQSTEPSVMGEPGDLPIEQPTRLELVVNMKAAKALGLSIPDSVLLRADELVR